ncbi:MAG TPA: hypothetical protein VKV19_15335 [Ktedonobacteraceae bacterium]|nr:hypothetical protein [Ktedonobacteraceae bacterium]
MQRKEADALIKMSADEWMSTSDWVAAQLRLSLQLLAMDAQDQIDHFLPGSDIISELITDYKHFAESIFTYWDLTDNQIDRLQALQDFFRMLDNENTNDLWTLEALISDYRWNEVRRLAKQALLSFQWALETPPPE